MRLVDFQNKHRGERCFIACNGPSLNDIPMKKLQGEIIFGLNRGYLKKDMPIKYHVVMVNEVTTQWGDELLAVDCDVLFTNRLEGEHVCHTPFGGNQFATDLSKPLHRGHTVTYPTIQIAFGMGFEEVYLIGCDHNFKYDNTYRDKTHHRRVINKGDDLNHFDPSYFGEGSLWLPYSPKMVEKNYSLATKAFEQSGRKLYNASTFTILPEKVIPRINFNDLKFSGE